MTKRSAAITVSATLAMLCLARPPALGDILVNGSFETPVVGLTGVRVISPGGEPAGFGWVVNSGNVEVFGELYPGLPGPAFDGQQQLDLNGVSVGTLSQSFATAAGLSYLLGFAYANNYVHTNQANPALATVRVFDTASGANLVTPLSISHGTSASTNLDWTTGTVMFTATGANSTLRFISNTSDPAGGILLDGVSVNGVSAVPEPSVTALLVVALAAAGLVKAVKAYCRRAPRALPGCPECGPA